MSVKKTATMLEGSKAPPKQQGDALDEFRRSVKKIELPMFSGEDPAGWIARAEVYFRVQDTSPEVKINLAQLCMEGHTIHFFRSLLDDEVNLTWEGLKYALLERYGGIGEGNVFEQLVALQQEASVDDYILEFEYLVAQVPKLPDEQYAGYFIHGLKEGIRGRVRSLKTLAPVTRSRLLNLARAVEIETQERRRNWVGSRLNGPKGHSGLGSQFRSNSTHGNGWHASRRTHGNDWVFVKGSKENPDRVRTGSTTKPKSKGEKRAPGSRDRGIRHISSQEVEERRRKGLCFKCGGPFHSRHQCPDRHLRLMVMEDDDEGEDGKVNLMIKEEGEDETEEEGELCVMGLAGLLDERRGRPSTMKFPRCVREVLILLLLDSGATHNFISTRLVMVVGWTVTETAPWQIRLGDGYRATTHGECKGVMLEIGSLRMKVDAVVFDLDGVDAVLGMTWLNSIGEMWIDWLQQLMRFQVNGQKVELKGEGTGSTGQLALQSFIGRPQKYVREFFWAALDHIPKVATSPVVAASVLSQSQQLSLQKLLDRFVVVFQEPKGLPPQRKAEHAIHLLEGQGPVNVRPYRYPYHHKNEIVRQVKELLESGVIRPSQSAFSSAIILVKKKDDS